MSTREYDFFVYILASRSHQLYIGITNSLERRVREHRMCLPNSYTARYNIGRLVYYEHFGYVLNAIAREKALKEWPRAKKIALIDRLNPTWRDLSEDWKPAVRMRGAAEQATATATADPALRDDNKER